MRIIRRLLALVLAAACVTGCHSYEARLLRHDFARDSADKLVANANRQQRNAVHHLGQAIGYEQARLADVLAAQNGRAGGDANLVAQNYIDYFGALQGLEKLYVSERAKIDSNHAEQVELAGNYLALDSMADDELRIADEAAKAALAEAMKAAAASWDAYQKAHPPKLPNGDKPDDAPEPEPIDAPAEAPVE